jgi:hypothetical protein
MPILKCQICDNAFYVKPSHVRLGWGKHCSVECRTKSQFKGMVVACLICHKKVYRSQAKMSHSKSGNHFCSKSCQTKWRNSFFIEEKHHNWLTGIRTYRNILLRSGKRQECMACNMDDPKLLVAHHIDHNRSNNKQSNLMWLCHNCHHLVHSDPTFELYVKSKISSK